MDPTVPDLSFLSGSWRSSDGTSTWESVYTATDGGHVVGASKELRDGGLYMTPFPFGNRSMEFALSDFDLGQHGSGRGAGPALGTPEATPSRAD